jgi:microcystin-dependent protein
MPRNSQGLYTPPLPPVRAGEVIESAWANTTVDDIGVALTGSLPRNGTAPMLAPLTLSNVPPSQPRHAVDKGYLDQFLAYATGMPTGAVIPLAGSAVPAGYLLCDGQAVSRTTYATLFSIIGTIYGNGDGANTFNVPDMRDWFIRGRNPSTRLVGSLQTGAFAAHTHPFQDPGHNHIGFQPAHSHSTTTPSHTHGVNDPGHFHQAPIYAHNDNGPLLGNADGGPSGTMQTDVRGTGISIAGSGVLAGSTDSQQPTVTTAANTTGATVGVTGESDTRPQNVAMNYIIKAIDDPAAITGITGITSSDENVVGISTANPTVPELVIKTNVAFGGVKLDAGAKIPLAQMPFENNSLLGFFDASSGQNPSQAYPATTFLNGDTFIVSVAGTIDVFNPVTETSAMTAVAVGSTLLYITGSVSSPTGWYTIVAAAATNASAVSFLPTGTISATNVQDAIAELDSETQTALAGKAPTSAATAVGTSFTPFNNLTAANVQAALEQVETQKADWAGLIATNVAYTPFGGVAATNVQNAINELDTEKATKTALAAATQGPAFIGSQAGPTGGGFSLTVLTDIVASQDPTGAWNAAGDRFQPNVAGIYQVNMRVTAQTSLAMSYAGCSIRKNSGGAGNQLNNYVAPYSGGLFAQPVVAGMFYFNGTTDYIQFLVDASGPGGTLNWSDAQVSAALVRPDSV